VVVSDAPLQAIDRPSPKRRMKERALNVRERQIVPTPKSARLATITFRPPYLS
jgi:hypothetical protein